MGSCKKKIVQLIGCVTLCLIILSTAFLNRTLILEPLAAFLQRNCSFTEMKDRITENYLGDRFRGKNKLLSLNGGFARLQGHKRAINILSFNDIVRTKKSIFLICKIGCTEQRII